MLDAQTTLQENNTRSCFTPSEDRLNFANRSSKRDGGRCVGHGKNPSIEARLRKYAIAALSIFLLQQLNWTVYS